VAVCQCRCRVLRRTTHAPARSDSEMRWKQALAAAAVPRYAMAEITSRPSRDVPGCSPPSPAQQAVGAQRGKGVAEGELSRSGGEAAAESPVRELSHEARMYPYYASP